MGGRIDLTGQTFGRLAENERRDANDLLRILRHRIAAADASITGFHVGTDCGGPAGQRGTHAHIHLIPRRTGDAAIP